MAGQGKVDKVNGMSSKLYFWEEGVQGFSKVAKSSYMTKYVDG